MELKRLSFEARKLAYAGKRFDDIRKELDHLSTNEELVQAAMKDVDLHIAGHQIAKQRKSECFNRVLIYAMFLTLGLFTTLYTVIVFQRIYILIVFAMLAVGWKLRAAYQKYKRPLESFLPENNRLKSKSRFQRY